MKGLLKNNFYAVRSSATIFSIFMLIVGTIVIVIDSQQFLLIYLLLGMIGFSMSAIAGIGRDYTSKWAKYKLTTPVKRGSIVKSYFIHLLIWLFVGMIFAGLVMCLTWLLHGCPFDRNIDAVMIFAVGISISLLTGAIFFPLFYLGGEERSGVFLVVSLLCAVGIVIGITAIINTALGPNMSSGQILLWTAIMLVCSFMGFAASYPATTTIFKRKEY